MSDPTKDFLLGLTRDIVSAYLSHNSLPKNEVVEFIEDVHKALARSARFEAEDHRPPEYEPVVPIEESVTNDVIYCLEDGLPFKSLKRHIRAKYNLSPEEYREKWKLPPDYPMVAPNYAKERSELAKKSGLGRKRNTPF